MHRIWTIVLTTQHVCILSSAKESLSSSPDIAVETSRSFPQSNMAAYNLFSVSVPSFLQLCKPRIEMMSLYSLLVVFVVLTLQLASAEDFKLLNGVNTILGEDRDPFKEGYFTIIISCFALVFFFLACMFAVRLTCDKQRGRDSRSFFLVA